jgi:hypothetical protein
MQDYVFSSTTLQVALATIGVLALLTAFVGWIIRLYRHLRKSLPERWTKGFGGDDGSSGGEPWAAENGIVFPAGSGADQFRPGPMRFYDDEDDRRSPVKRIVAGGLDEIAGTRERIVDAVRERPLEFIAGALATGFAVGLVMPLFSTKSRTAKLLQRLLEERSGARTEANRFRRARPK